MCRVRNSCDGKGNKDTGNMGKLSALTWGSPSDPPVLLCHGRMDVCSSFRPLVSLLPRTFYYVSLELPGNGKSDPLSSSGRYTIADLVPSVTAVQNHFKWDNFIFIGHSFGVVIGKYFNLAYPGVITRMVELDPVPASYAWSLKDFPSWYHFFYADFYQEEKYEKYTSLSVDNAPKYTYTEALRIVMNGRGLKEERARHILERSLQPAGDGLFSFTYDPRQRKLTCLPFTPEYIEELYTSVPTPTLCILSEVMTEMGAYDPTPFVKDVRSWPHGNYRVRTAPGGHDLHISTPELIAQDISIFLTETKAKL